MATGRIIVPCGAARTCSSVRPWGAPVAMASVSSAAPLTANTTSQFLGGPLMGNGLGLLESLIVPYGRDVYCASMMCPNTFCRNVEIVQEAGHTCRQVLRT